MEAAVVGAAVGATVKVVLQNLISVSVKDFKLVQDFKEDLEKLSTTLIMIQEYVDGAEAVQDSNASVRGWLKKLEHLAYKAYSVLNEIRYLSLRAERQNGAFKKMINSMASYFYDPHKFGHKIKQINKDFESINREASGLGIQASLVALQATGVASHASAGEETDSFTCDPVFLGRENDVKEIVEKITNIQPDQVFSILPIVGMGGMGKSTLARQVIKVQIHFQTHIWVHVSANFDPIILFKKILMVLRSHDAKIENREVVLKNLKNALENKTYLLILDDVWNEEGLKWEGFINSLYGITSTNGNAIIVTTRKENVSSIVATLPIHYLQGLPEDTCWSIIKAKAFGGGMIPSEFESLGTSIASRCQGLPLAANVVGGVLRGKSRNEWDSIQQNWLSDHAEGDFIKRVLKLSFDNLPSPSLKKCFAYCSIFPKGAHMMRVDLIQLWMAEGFLEADQRSDMETVGNKFFNLLLHNSLLRVVDRDDYSDVVGCNMHDLVHDVSMKVNDKFYDGIYQARYPGHEFYGHDSKEKAKKVRTLFVKGGLISDVVFSNFKSLHVLTLIGYHVKDLSSAIRELMHLKYLNISETSIEKLPNTISELYHLQTLRAELSGLWKLPNTLKYLVSLRHLHVSNDTELPGELGMLTSLQTIPYFRVRYEKGHQIVELGRLKNLKGKLRICSLEKVRNKKEAESACIFQNSSIVELVLRWHDKSIEQSNTNVWWNDYTDGEPLRDEPIEGKPDYENVLEGLQPHPNLKRLEIFGFKGTRFPSWTLKMAVQDEHHLKRLDNLMKITLERCSECEEIPMMGHLPHLKSLYLINLWNMKLIGSSFYGIDHYNEARKDVIVFPALQHLVLKGMTKMTEWVEVELGENQSRQVKVFPRLEYLEINDCKRLKSAPSHFPCLKELEIERMDSGLPLRNICGAKLTSLTNLRICGLNELESLPFGLFYNNQHLSKLSILCCPRLKELADGLHTLDSLQDLRIQSCPTLKSIPHFSSCQSFTSLSSLIIYDCPKLMNLSAEMVDSSLECLHLEGLRSVMNMQMIIDRLYRMPRLTRLNLRLPKFTITSSTEAPSFRSLRELSIQPDLYSDSWDCVSYKEAVDGILTLFGSQSLHKLDLSGKEDWESLPDQLQHLSALFKAI